MDAGLSEEVWDDVSVSIVLIVVFVSITRLSKQIQMMHVYRSGGYREILRYLVSES
jgi:hypothetical protein